MTMAATIALCIFTSAWIFGQIEPYVAEVTGYDEPTAIPVVAQETSNDEEAPSDSADSAASESTNTQPESGGQPTVAPAQPTATTSDFEATHYSNPSFTVNFRPGPSVSSGDPIDTLSPNTPLQFLDEEARDEEGVIWLQMQTEDGEVGWLREVDTEPIFD